MRDNPEEFLNRPTDGPEPTVFDAILSGDIPSHKVYEDERVYAFLDIAPLAPGHTLVIPKERARYLHELSSESSAAVGAVLPKIALAVCEATGARAYNLLQNNGSGAHQAVFHVHFHIIPKMTVGNQERGLGIGWQPGQLAAEDGAKLAAAISRALESNV